MTKPRHPLPPAVEALHKRRALMRELNALLLAKIAANEAENAQREKKADAALKRAAGRRERQRRTEELALQRELAGLRHEISIAERSLEKIKARRPFKHGRILVDVALLWAGFLAVMWAMLWFLVEKSAPPSVWLAFLFIYLLTAFLPGSYYHATLWLPYVAWRTKEADATEVEERIARYKQRIEAFE